MPRLRQANDLAYNLGPYRAGQPRAWTAVTVSRRCTACAGKLQIIDSRVNTFFGQLVPSSGPNGLSPELSVDGLNTSIRPRP